MLLDLSPAQRCQQELALEQEPQSSEHEKLMRALDAINLRFGRGTLQLASAGLEGEGSYGLCARNAKRRVTQHTGRSWRWFGHKRL